MCGKLADCYETLTGVSHLLKVNVQMMFVYLRRWLISLTWIWHEGDSLFPRITVSVYIHIYLCVCVGDEVTLFISHKYNKDGITLCVFFCLIWLTFPKQHCQKSGRCVCLYHWFIYWYLFKVDLTVTHTERNPTIKLPPLSKHWRQWERKTPL